MEELEAAQHCDINNVIIAKTVYLRMLMDVGSVMKWCEQYQRSGERGRQHWCKTGRQPQWSGKPVELFGCISDSMLDGNGAILTSGELRGGRQALPPPDRPDTLFPPPTLTA